MKSKEQAELTFLPSEIARGANRRYIEIKLLHRRESLLSPGEVSDHRNDLLAD